MNSPPPGGVRPIISRPPWHYTCPMLCMSVDGTVRRARRPGRGFVYIKVAEENGLAFRFNRLRKKKKGAFFFSVSEWSGVSEDEQSHPGNRRSFDCGTGELRRRSVGPRPQLAWAHGLRSPSAILPAYPRPRRDAREAWAHGLQAHAQWEHVREHSGARGWVYNYLVFHHVIRPPARFFDFSLSLLRMHETVPRMMHAASRVLIREVSLFQRLICTQEYTIGTSETVLIREVSLFQRLICTQEYTIGTSETVLIREASLFQRLICTQDYSIGASETVLIREASLFQRLICTQEYTSETVLIREASLFQTEVDKS